MVEMIVLQQYLLTQMGKVFEHLPTHSTSRIL
jgi:hypothetical protein